MTAFRATVHLAPLELEMLGYLDRERKVTLAIAERAEQTFRTAATATAVARGINPSKIGELTPAGLIVEVTPPTAKPGADDAE